MNAIMNAVWHGLMVKMLACQVKGPGFKSDHRKSFGKKKCFRKKCQPSSACMMEVWMMGVLHNF